MASVHVTMNKSRETKGTFFYEEKLVQGQSRGHIGSLYLTKAAAAELGNPETISVEVKAS